MSFFNFKALRSIRFPGRSYVLFGSPRPTDSDITRDVGDGTAANVVMTPIRWLQRSIIEAPIVVERDGDMDVGHELSKLIQRPNEFYSGDHLLAATLLSLEVDGNAYWLILSNARGRPVQLWYVPHYHIEPKFPSDGSAFITHYEYTVGGQKQNIDIQDVIHFRDGLDPNNIRKGLSSLKALMREVWTDMECGLMVAALMKNGGVPGVVISPDSDEPIDEGDATAAKEYVNEKFTRESRGKTLVMKGKTRVSTFGFTPREMDLSAIRNISEERVCAALGIPAAVVGFGTGVHQTKVGATLKELRKLAWFNGVIPIQRVIKGELDNKLMPKYRQSGRSAGQVKFNNSEVTALQEDENERAERIANMVVKGLWTRAEGREATGKEASPADDVFLQPISVIQVPRGGRLPIEQRSSGELEHKSEHTLTEGRIARNAPRIDEPPEALIVLANQLARIVDHLAPALEDDLFAFFVELGEAAFEASMPVVKQQIETEQILEGILLADLLLIFQQTLERGATRVSGEVNAAVNGAIGVSANLPDSHARAIVAAGGTRAGLIDLSAQTKRAIFDELARGRAEGLAGENLARRIRDKVEAGPWSSAKVRAWVIARTETAFAVNKSSIEKAKSMDGVERMLVFDNRIGFNDAVCSDLDQRVVTMDEADQLMSDEHPNGTRSFTPLPPGLASGV